MRKTRTENKKTNLVVKSSFNASIPIAACLLPAFEVNMPTKEFERSI
jgi:hypothetical protein